MLLAVPNFSEGRDPERIERSRAAFASGAALLDTHSDTVHNRTVLTLTGPQGPSPARSRAGARRLRRTEIDMRRHDGAHPCVGALDVCPVVWLRRRRSRLGPRGGPGGGQADRLRAAVPVFLYGELAPQQSHRERAFFRSGGAAELERRLAAGELRPDFGPARAPSKRRRDPGHRPPAARGLQPRAARAPRSRTLARSRPGFARPGAAWPAFARSGSSWTAMAHPGVDQRPRPGRGPAGRGRRAGPRARHGRAAPRVVGAEVVGLIPEAALDGWPEEIPLRGFDPAAQTIERRVRG